jgi:DNA uptake protein ComE-like DNA-binding protein
VRVRDAITPGLVVVLALVHVLSLAADPERPPAPTSCTFAVMVDGALRCDDDAPRSIIEACGGASDHVLRSGDAIDCASGSVARMDPDALAELELPVDVNTADAEELASLPGVGPVIAKRIVDGRPYASVDDLDRVKGIGAKTLARLRARARV